MAEIAPHTRIHTKLCTICFSAEADLNKPGRMACTDCRELMDRAIAALTVARRDGCMTQGYDPSSWRKAQHRLDHAATHIYQLRRGDKTEDHLAHAICDLVMLYEV